MADNVTVELGGSSKYEVARMMAREIFRLEGKMSMNEKLDGVTRREYLKTVYECMQVLNGVPPK